MNRYAIILIGVEREGHRYVEYFLDSFYLVLPRGYNNKTIFVAVTFLECCADRYNLKMEIFFPCSSFLSFIFKQNLPLDLYAHLILFTLREIKAFQSQSTTISEYHAHESTD